jgi:hypothetical protein
MSIRTLFVLSSTVSIATVLQAAQTVSLAVSHNFNNIESLLHNTWDGDIQSTKAIVAAAPPITQNAILSSKLDALSSDLDVCCMELNDNDFKIFSVLDRIDTKLIVGVNSIHEKLGSQSIEQETVPTKNQNIIVIKQEHIDSLDGCIITHSGNYRLIESLFIAGNNGITIQADNVYLDLGEYTIAALDEEAVPLKVEKANNVIIKHGSLVGGKGLEINDSENITVEDLHTTNTRSSGVALHHTNNFFIVACTVHDSVHNGFFIGKESSNGIIKNIVASDCAQSGVVISGNRIVVENSIMQHNGEHGIAVHAGHTIQIQSISSEANSIHGIVVDAATQKAHIEGCRTIGNGNSGCVDDGAQHIIWVNNLSSGNGVDDYINIRAVSLSKATSYWHNVYSN